MTDGEIVEAVVETRTLVRSLHERLLGDNETGEIPKMRKDINQIQTERAEDRGKITMLRWIVGALGLGGIGHVIQSWKGH
jgi:hypothetical protein